MRVFISYAHADVERVKQVVDILRSGGHDPWFDPWLLPGQDWQVELLAAITACKAFVYMLTPESVASEWCQWEYAKAIGMGKSVVPVLLRQCTIPKEISRFQYADFSSNVVQIPENGIAIAQLMGGLTHIASLRVFAPTIIQVPPKPSGIPAQAVQNSQIEVADILPPPFEWCPIPQGFVTLEDASSRDGTQGGSYQVPAFAIARYPITNAQYQVFVDAHDGYHRLVWWDYSRETKAWRMEHPTPVSTAFEGDDLPRTNICWYDTVAFCRWLSEKSGQKIKLPTEQQWQRAAQGDTNQKYPWGNENPDKYRCNFNSNIGEPTPVDQYPKGASPYGVMDMIGNVCDWCITEWGTDSIKVGGDNRRVFRGNSWRGGVGDKFRVAYRGGDYPQSENPHFGFRIALL